MVTLQANTTRYTNDITRPLFCEGPAGQVLPHHEYLVTADAYLGPGMPYARSTGAGGEATITKVAKDSPMVHGFVDLDDKITLAGTATVPLYASGVKVPCIPIDKNLGAILRNILVEDPNAAVPTDTPLCSMVDTNESKCAVVIEAAFVDAVTGHEAFDNGGATPGLNGAAGSQILSRIIARNEYYIADPGADVRVIARLTRN